MSTLEVGRMSPKNDRTNPVLGKVVRSSLKSLRFWTHALVVIVGGYMTVGTEQKASRPAQEQKRPRTTLFFNEP
jgi:hypothetical protein